MGSGHRGDTQMSDDIPVFIAPQLPPRIRIGAFFLETLTTGMYEDAFHCIREYVQNGFDAIRDAVVAGLLSEGDGRITVAIGGTAKSPSLSIKDTGTGVRMSDAVDRFVSLGASVKQPVSHAGFRGIGRLAGIAYCSTLKFTTKAIDEELATVFEFDCGKLRGFMAPGAEPRDVSDVIRSSVAIRTIPQRARDHFTEVEMIGLSGLGLEFVEQDRLVAYLSEYSPVEYAEGFDLAERIRALASSFAASIPVVEVDLRNRRDRIPIRKPYRNSFPTSTLNTKSTVRDLESYNSKEHGWFGWFGISNFPGEITDETVAGVRFRMKNIQIGDEGIIEDIATRLTPSGSERRLQRWAVGEVFITNTEVVPNARRDGFEDNQAWRNVQADIKEVAKRIIKRIRSASTARAKIKQAEGKIEANRSRLADPKVTKRVAGEVDQDLRRQLLVLEKSTSTGADPKEVSELIGQIKELREQLHRRDLEDDPPTTTAGPTEPEVRPDIPPSHKPRSLIEVVREVLLEELGENETERLMALIKERAKGLGQ